jgi:serine/threonine protein phosphatase 1
MAGQQVFAILRRARRIWAVASIHGEANRLDALHHVLWERFAPGDRLVYLGNIVGRGPTVRDTLDLLIEFRRHLLARPGMFAYDIAYLRGSQEEMWDKLLQLQFAPNPREVMEWMLAQGIASTLAAYGASPAQALGHARSGPMALARWTSALRREIQAAPGHVALMSALRRAAYSDDQRLLFVNAGIDPERPLSAQNDALWWGQPGAFPLRRTFERFVQVIRGYDRAHGGLRQGPFSTSLDAGCGHGGPLLAACFAPDGRLLDTIEG